MRSLTPPPTDPIPFVGIVLVLDGEDPTGWAPWEDAFGVLLTKWNRDLQSRVAIPEAYHASPRVRLQLVAVPASAVMTRPEWGAVVGVIMDGDKSAQAAKKLNALVCQKVAAAKEALYRRVKYHLMVIASDPQRQVDLARELKADAKDLLGPASVAQEACPTSRETLMFQLEHWTRGIVYEALQSSRAGPS